MSSRRITHCVGSPGFQPQQLVEDPGRQSEAQQYLAKDDLLSASRVLFSLPDPDEYVYHAMTSVKLAEVQRVISLGGVNGLHAWYRAEDGSPVRHILRPVLKFTTFD
jgi:hypothetical protein